MSGFPPVTPSPELPEEFRFLCMLHNVGATNAERSLSLEEIAKWTDKGVDVVSVHLQRLRELGYVQCVEKAGIYKFHVSVTGIRKVLTLYS